MYKSKKKHIKNHPRQENMHGSTMPGVLHSIIIKVVTQEKVLYQRHGGPGDMVAHLKVVEQDLVFSPGKLQPGCYFFGAQSVGLYPFEINPHKVMSSTTRADQVPTSLGSFPGMEMKVPGI